MIPIRFSLTLIFSHPSPQFNFNSYRTKVKVREKPNDLNLNDNNNIPFYIRDVNNNMMELLILIYACKTSSAATITAILPYMP